MNHETQDVKNNFKSKIYKNRKYLLPNVEVVVGAEPNKGLAPPELNPPVFIF